MRQSTKSNITFHEAYLKLKLKSKIDKRIKPICCHDYKEKREAPSNVLRYFYHRRIRINIFSCVCVPV